MLFTMPSSSRGYETYSYALARPGASVLAIMGWFDLSPQMRHVHSNIPQSGYHHHCCHPHLDSHLMYTLIFVHITLMPVLNECCLCAKTSNCPQFVPAPLLWSILGKGVKAGMARARSTGPFGPIAVGNQKGGENRSIGGIPECRVALDDDLYLNECFT